MFVNYTILFEKFSSYGQYLIKKRYVYVNPESLCICHNGRSHDALRRLLDRFTRNYLLVEGPHLERCRRLRIPRSIASFPTSDVGNLFRIRSHDALLRLLAVWDIPNTKQVADITRRRTRSTSRYS